MHHILKLEFKLSRCKGTYMNLLLASWIFRGTKKFSCHFKDTSNVKTDVKCQGKWAALNLILELPVIIQMTDQRPLGNSFSCAIVLAFDLQMFRPKSGVLLLCVSRFKSTSKRFAKYCCAIFTRKVLYCSLQYTIQLLNQEKWCRDLRSLHLHWRSTIPMQTTGKCSLWLARQIKLMNNQGAVAFFKRYQLMRTQVTPPWSEINGLTCFCMHHFIELEFGLSRCKAPGPPDSQGSGMGVLALQKCPRSTGASLVAS